jgi:hypothetical protein
LNLYRNDFRIIHNAAEEKPGHSRTYPRQNRSCLRQPVQHVDHHEISASSVQQRHAGMQTAAGRQHRDTQHVSDSVQTHIGQCEIQYGEDVRQRWRRFQHSDGHCGLSGQEEDPVSQLPRNRRENHQVLCSGGEAFGSAEFGGAESDS